MASSDPDPGPRAAAAIFRGARRLLFSHGYDSVTEVTLKTGRRADILAIGEDGTILIVEVKSGLRDFQSDGKWPEYRAFCDRFYFAVDPDFPRHALPDDCGIIIADAHEGAFTRPAPEHRLNAQRRRTLITRAARLAARRVHQADDPGLGYGPL